MDDGKAMLDEMRAALHERQQQGLRKLIGFHGGLERWFAACRARRGADADYQLARIIARLLRTGGDPGPLRLSSGDRDRLAADPALDGFWRSVAEAGPDGWREERQRVRATERQAREVADPQARLLMLDVHAVKSLLPTYRAWGRMLLDASSASGIA